MERGATNIEATHPIKLPFDEAAAGDLWRGRAAFGDRSGRVVVYDLSSGRSLAEIATKADELTGLWLCSDGSHVICQISYQDAEIWNFRTGKLLRVDREARRFDFDRERTTATVDGSPALLLGLSDGPQTMMELREKPKQYAEGAAICGDGKLAATLVGPSNTPSIMIWDTVSRTHTKSLRTRGRDNRKGSRRYSPASVRFAPSGQWLAFWSSWTDIDLLHIDGRGVLLCGHTENVEMAAFSANGRFLASCSEGNEIIVWEIPSGRIMARAPASYPVSHLHIWDEGTVSLGLKSGRIELLALERANGGTIASAHSAELHAVGELGSR